MKVKFNESFLKDLKSVKDKSILTKVKATIEASEVAETLDAITHLIDFEISSNRYDGLRV